jgi:hypothetical protein
MNVNIWIRNPYPFRFDEREAIQEALRLSGYGTSIVYLKEGVIDLVSIDGTNITTCRNTARTLKAIHLQWAIQDKKHTGRVYCQDLAIEIRGISDGRPDWAREEHHERETTT